MTNTPCDLDEADPTETNWRKNVCPACDTHHPNGWACPKDLAVVRKDNARLRADTIRLADELAEARAEDKLASSVINKQIDVNQGLRAELAEARLKVGSESVVLAMTVDRLGGIVEGHPTARLNFLQRVDELREIEHKYRCLLEGDKTKLAEARAENERLVVECDRWIRANIAANAAQERLLEALTRLTSMEALTLSRMVRRPQDNELIARIDFANAALLKSSAPTPDTPAKGGSIHAETRQSGNDDDSDRAGGGVQEAGGVRGSDSGRL